MQWQGLVWMHLEYLVQAKTLFSMFIRKNPDNIRKQNICGLFCNKNISLFWKNIVQNKSITSDLSKYHILLQEILPSEFSLVLFADFVTSENTLYFPSYSVPKGGRRSRIMIYFKRASWSWRSTADHSFVHASTSTTPAAKLMHIYDMWQNDGMRPFLKKYVLQKFHSNASALSPMFLLMSCFCICISLMSVCPHINPSIYSRSHSVAVCVTGNEGALHFLNTKLCLGQKH